MKAKISSAQTNRVNSFDNSCTHVTTMDFGRLKPTFSLNVLRGDKINLNYSQFTRLSPLVAPTFGSAQLKSYAFWVPVRILWRGYERYVARSVDSSVETPLPNFNLMWLMKYLLGSPSPNINDTNPFEPSVYESAISAQGLVSSLRPTFVEATGIQTNGGLSPDGYDYVIGSPANGNFLLFRWNSKGRYFMDILRCLGYEVPTYVNVDAGDGVNYELCSLPLQAFFRCLYDWVYPSAYVQQQGFGWLFEEDIDFTSDSALNEGKAYYWFRDALNLLFVPYEQDFFNSLWASPTKVAAGGSAPADVYSKMVSGSILSVSSDNNVVAVNQDNSNQRATLNADALRWLTRLNDFVMRNNIGGSRFGEWLRAHTGWTSQMDDIDMSKFLKSWKDEIRISDVTNTNDSSYSSPLGSVAGKAYSNGGGSLRFEAKEAGFIIVMSMVTPLTAYYQGMAPWCDSISSPFDFYTDSFDNVGFEAIPMRHIFNDPNSLEMSGNLGVDSVFGFAPRYANRYKRGHDLLTGMFRFRSQNEGLDAYHTFRDLSFGRGDTPPVLDSRFMHVDNQFDRIFAVPQDYAVNSDYYERMFTIFRFNCTRYSHMMSISESLPIFDKSGSDVSLDYQGSQIN